MKTKSFGKRGRRKKIYTTPSRRDLENAIEDYLKNGGVITKLEPGKRNIREVLSVPDTVSDIDELLGKS